MRDTRQIDPSYPIDPNHPMTLEELREFLRVSKYTLQEYLAEGLGVQAGFKVGKEWRFMPLEVIDWLKERHRKRPKDHQKGLSQSELQKIASRALKAQKPKG